MHPLSASPVPPRRALVRLVQSSSPMGRSNRHAEKIPGCPVARPARQTAVDPLDLPTETCLDLSEDPDDSELLETADLSALVEAEGPYPETSGDFPAGYHTELERAAVHDDPVSLCADDVAELLGDAPEACEGEAMDVSELAADPAAAQGAHVLLFCKAGEAPPCFAEPGDELPRFAIGKRRALARFGKDRNADAPPAAAQDKGDLPGFAIDEVLPPLVKPALPSFLLDELPKAVVRRRMKSLPAFGIEDTVSQMLREPWPLYAPESNETWPVYRPEHHSRCHRKRHR